MSGWKQGGSNVRPAAESEFFSVVKASTKAGGRGSRACVILRRPRKTPGNLERVSKNPPA